MLAITPIRREWIVPPTVVDIIRLIVLVALVTVFVVMGLNHFRAKPARIMARMIPPRLRFDGPFRPITLVYLTGVCEVLGGIGLAVPLTRPVAAIALVLFLIAVFPANVYASQHPETFRSLAIPLWPRLAAQVAVIALIVWVGLL
jgi:uncharacterized membrane protein